MNSARLHRTRVPCRAPGKMTPITLIDIPWFPASVQLTSVLFACVFHIISDQRMIMSDKRFRSQEGARWRHLPITRPCIIWFWMGCPLKLFIYIPCCSIWNLGEISVHSRLRLSYTYERLVIGNIRWRERTGHFMAWKGIHWITNMARLSWGRTRKLEAPETWNQSF